ncbi:unnamed protein product [Hymenolepis diminuta]|uniref:YqaJ domain-containing protein n=1 Tax=Hymenolepis diminuta TaxID=6216 RepID=A0A0R3SFG8_HYMDI|nr:unnamed protein product [Hymenolepis diminuta]
MYQAATANKEPEFCENLMGLCSQKTQPSLIAKGTASYPPDHRPNDTLIDGIIELGEIACPMKVEIKTPAFCYPCMKFPTSFVRTRKACKQFLKMAAEEWTNEKGAGLKQQKSDAVCRFGELGFKTLSFD